MTISITLFLAALNNPTASFVTLGNMEVKRTPNGMPVLRRTTEWVECEVMIGARRYLLAAPLAERAARLCASRFEGLQQIDHPSFVTPQRLVGELRLRRGGIIHQTDIILQELVGVEFTQIEGQIDGQVICEALDRMVEGWSALNLSHNNLKKENLRWCEGRIVPIRYFDLTRGCAEHRDRDTVARLKQGYQPPKQEAKPQKAVATAHPFIWMGNEFDGLICVRTERGYGYVDSAHNFVIEPQYHWADDFCEGRAVVQTPKGMGLIDRNGNYILEPIYEIVEYDDIETRIRARRRGRWREYDYNGKAKK